MGLFGGSAQSSQQLSSSINFSPVFQIGDENETEASASQTPSQSLSPTQRDEMRFAASVGIGGSGGPATFTGGTEMQPKEAEPATQQKKARQDNMLLIAAAGSIAAFMLLSKKKNKK